MNDLLDQGETLQNLLVSHATGGSESDAEYRQLRQTFASDPRTEILLPRFVRSCRNLSQFWEFIKHRFGTYHERRVFLWEEFQPLISTLEKGVTQPADGLVSDVLQEFDTTHVNAAWSKALDRRQSDPEGAITMARSLLESVCKHILDEAMVEYDETADLPKLYKQTAEQLNLAPSQHTEQVFKQILGGCTAIVGGLGSLRNRLSDSHGKGRSPVKPASRHAELAVNLSGTAAQFLIATWKARTEPAA
jgi:hypothetical protein